MDFEVYCDESGLEAFNDKEAHKFASIGGIWLPSDYRSKMKSEIKFIRDKFKIYGEFKWQKVSPSFVDFYKAILDYFFSTECLRFRAIVVEAEKVDNIKFNNSDGELGFYKFYYQLLHHWIFDFNSYSVFPDFKINRDQDRLKDLKRVLGKANLTSNVMQIQALPSDESVGIQLADLLTGMVSSKFNSKTTGNAKKELIEYTENFHLKRRIAPTPKWEEKFNIFKINLQGGW